MTQTVHVDENLERKLVAMRRDLHSHPELSWHEGRTAERICEYLGEIGVEYKRICGTGVVAEIRGQNSQYPAVAIRADLDALPVQEETGLDFASLHAGKMHACGHDGHTSMVLGAAELLVSRRHELKSVVRFIFQPAEELGTGALRLMENGVLENVGSVFGGHLDRHYSTGDIVISDGVMNASTDSFRIVITGQGGHAARPHESIDAVVVGSLMVMALQTIVSREVNPAHPSVVTVGKFTAGTACNVISAQAVLEGTVRAQEPLVRAHLKSALQRMATAVGQLHNAGVSVEFFDSTPALINDKGAAAVAREAAALVVGAGRVTDLRVANMGGEDFSYYLEQVPGCYVRFGAQIQGREGFPAHSSKFDFDEAALAIGAKYFAEVALRAAVLHQNANDSGGES